MNEFGKFLNSPFHNESLKMVRLFNYLKKFHPDFKSELLSRELIFRKMYGDAGFSDKKLRERFSDMMRLADDFLAIVNARKNPVRYKMFTLDEFSGRNLAVHFDKKHREIFNLTEKQVFKNENSLYDDYMLYSKKIGFYQSLKPVGKRKPFFDEFSVYVEMFLRYFTAQMLQNYSVINNIKNVINHPYEKQFYGEVMKYADEQDLERYPLIKALRLMIKINENREDTASYFSLKKIYLKYHSKMSSSDKAMIGTELFVHTRIMVRTGRIDFKSECLDMMKLQIEHKTHPIENGYMKRETFLASVDTALSQGDDVWARTFIKDHSSDVAPELRKDINYWAKATMLYNEKKYEMALTEFSRIKTSDFVFYFWVKVPVSRIYYELKEYDKVLMLIDSYNHYTAANKLIPDYSKVWYSAYFSLLYKVTSLALKYDEHKLLKLADEIKKSPLSSNSTWLTEKLYELKK